VRKLSKRIIILFSVWATASSLGLLLSGCGGKAPSTLLRQGQTPYLDFPLYVTGGPGKVWKFDRNGTKTVLIDNLNDPKGIATDRYNNLYVVEQGLGRVLKVDATSGTYTVAISGLLTPSVVAVDSVDEVYVTQEGSNNIIRIRDGTVKSTFSSRPSALSFGVNDLMLVGLFDENIVRWGTTSTASVNQPVNIGTDSTGRVYVAEGLMSGAKIYRFNQRESTGSTVVADSLTGVSGFVVDPVGNIYISEAGASRILLATQAGSLLVWASGITAPEYMTFTKY
jgi:hypothetical protein